MTDHDHCVTPYILTKDHRCLTKENATTSLLFARQYQDTSSYSLPCNLVNTELLLESFFTIPESEHNITFILNLPTTVRTTSATYSYTFLSFIAEFGSWVGLFTGVALTQVAIIFIKMYYHIHINCYSLLGSKITAACLDLHHEAVGQSFCFEGHLSKIILWLYLLVSKLHLR